MPQVIEVVELYPRYSHCTLDLHSLTEALLTSDACLRTEGRRHFIGFQSTVGRTQWGSCKASNRSSSRWGQFNRCVLFPQTAAKMQLDTHEKFRNFTWAYFVVGRLLLIDAEFGGFFGLHSHRWENLCPSRSVNRLLLISAKLGHLNRLYATSFLPSSNQRRIQINRNATSYEWQRCMKAADYSISMDPNHTLYYPKASMCVGRGSKWTTQQWERDKPSDVT